MLTLANQASPLAKLLYTRQNEEFANFGDFCDNHSKLNKLLKLQFCDQGVCFV